MISYYEAVEFAIETFAPDHNKSPGKFMAWADDTSVLLGTIYGKSPEDVLYDIQEKLDILED